MTWLPRSIRRLDGPLGAEILGADLSGPLRAPVALSLQAALAEHCLVVLRDQILAPAAQLALAESLGPVVPHVVDQFRHAEQPGLLVVSNAVNDNAPGGLGDTARFWHADMSYLPLPGSTSVLQVIECAEDGDEMLFADQIAAYALLDDATRRQVQRLRAEHDFAWRADLRTAAGLRPDLAPHQRDAVPPVLHPVVRFHPASGRPALFVSHGYTRRIHGVEEAESERLLGVLLAATTDPSVTLRHRLRRGDVLIWDNAAVQNQLAFGGDPSALRTFWRATTRGALPCDLGSTLGPAWIAAG
jgi:taurine dioxygenase